ncbi:MAG: hypothetical protein U0586_12455 [Candidatus Brocadiaceae bacterium]
MTRTMRFDSTLHAVIVHPVVCALRTVITDKNPSLLHYSVIATLFCHCEQSEAIFLS